MSDRRIVAGGKRKTGETMNDTNQISLRDLVPGDVVRMRRRIGDEIIELGERKVVSKNKTAITIEGNSRWSPMTGARYGHVGFWIEPVMLTHDSS